MLVPLWFIIISLVISVLENYYVHVSFNFKVILYEAKISENTGTEYLL